MNVINTSEEQDFVSARQANLLGDGLQDLRSFAKSVTALRASVSALKELGDDNTCKRAERLLRQLDTFEPSVTMIGQIKSGKTSLVNAFVGQIDLLPADVNPWTSVVTSLHLYPETKGFENSASFQFFEADEWDKLVSGGGRIGELASRAGADDELEKIKEQVAQMREKSRARLGNKFEVLLGQERTYGYFDKDLIERYVCLGEELEEGVEAPLDGQGRFADITKAADLRMQRLALPTRLCIRDTPGVNDTFMMREQITIRSIRDSRICVVVLSAHQALSSSDMALIRLISHVKSRDVIIFVNRIDELSDPATQVPQIARSISDTLERHKGPGDAQVIFGSAHWASAALHGDMDMLSTGSTEALKNWAASDARQNTARGVVQDQLSTAWVLSGMPALQSAIADRVANGVGHAILQRVGGSAANLANGIAAANRMSVADVVPELPNPMNSETAQKRIAEIMDTETLALKAAFDSIIEGFGERMDRVQASFLERATASLIVHLDKYGEQSPWTYDPTGLRVLLNASHQVLARKSHAAFENATKSAGARFVEVYQGAFALGADQIGIVLPKAPQVPPPVTLGRTIALDLQGSWWKRWWSQRRGYKAHAESFYALIKSETNPFVSELRDDLAQDVRNKACEAFDVFLHEQLSVFEGLDKMRHASPKELEAFAAKNSQHERLDLLEKTLKTLNEYASS